MEKVLPQEMEMVKADMSFGCQNDFPFMFGKRFEIARKRGMGLSSGHVKPGFSLSGLKNQVVFHLLNRGKLLSPLTRIAYALKKNLSTTAATPSSSLDSVM